MNNTRAALASSQAVSPESIFMFLPTGYDAHTVRCGQESVAAVSPPGLAGFTDVNKGGGSLRLVVGALPRAGRHSTTAARGHRDGDNAGGHRAVDGVHGLTHGGTGPFAPRQLLRPPLHRPPIGGGHHLGGGRRSWRGANGPVPPCVRPWTPSTARWPPALSPSRWPRAAVVECRPARGRAPTTSRNEPPPLFTSVKPARPGGETAATDSCPQRTVCAS